MAIYPPPPTPEITKMNRIIFRYAVDTFCECRYTRRRDTSFNSKTLAKSIKFSSVIISDGIQTFGCRLTV